MPLASFYTLGCRLNQTETGLIAHSLTKLGYQITEAKEGADLCVINSCTVTGQTDLKCRQLIRQVQKNNPGALVAVVGCFSQMATDQILQIGGVDLILGTEEKLNLARYLKEAQTSEVPIIKVGPISGQAFEQEGAPPLPGQTRANLKIQEGCDFICSFCIIPKARGRSRSRRLANLLEEARMLGERGVKELVLTGVNLGCWEEEKKGFLDLIEALEETPGIERLRISSIEPTTLGREVFASMADPKKKLVPHLHLPLQSGSDEVLLAMRRRYSAHEYMDYLWAAKEAVPGLGLGSDVIAGFPGETEADFLATYELLKKSPIHYFHVFPFASRPGTKAALAEKMVESKEINRRALALRELNDQKRDLWAQEHQGETLLVLFEGGPRAQGYGPNYLRVEVTAGENELTNQILPVKITDSLGGLALGELV